MAIIPPSIHCLLTVSHQESTRKIGPRRLHLAARDRADYWFQKTGQRRLRFSKKTGASTVRIPDKLLGTMPSMNVDVEIQKASPFQDIRKKGCTH